MMDHFAQLNAQLHKPAPSTELTKREYIAMEFMKILMAQPSKDRYVDKDLMIVALRYADEFLTFTERLPGHPK